MRVNLPHDAMLAEERSAVCNNGERTGYYPGGEYRYEKKFVLTEHEANGYVAVRFGGVYRHAVVYLNDMQIAAHRYGYTPFTVNLSGKVNAGENKITVDVDNRLEPNSRWYTGSGIYRTVALIKKPQNNLRKLRVRTLSTEPPTVEVTCNEERAEIQILHDSTLIAAGKPGIFQLPDVQLWSAENPALYTCRAEWNGETEETSFGIRQLGYSPQSGFFINGKQILLRGGCVHHDNGILGACSFADAERRRVRILKESGYNAVRCAHNPCSDEFLDACDRLGLYVLDEAYDGWYTPKTHHDASRSFHEDWRSTLQEMADRDYNHPSVILYSIGNEVTEVGSPQGVKQAQEMTKWLHELDNTRPVTCGINTMLTVWGMQGLGIYKDKEPYQPVPLPQKQENKSGSALFNALSMRLGKWMGKQTAGKKADAALHGISGVLDILGLNYGQSRYRKELLNSERVLLGTETYISDLPYNWKIVKENPALIGDFCWTAFDYIGETGIGYWAYPDEKGLPLLAGCGAIDLIGCRDAMNAFQKVVWGLEQRPYIAAIPIKKNGKRPLKRAWRFTNALPCWTWAGQESSPMRVEVYTQAAHVELWCNNKKAGEKTVQENRAVFKIPYTPGTLRAVVLDEKGNATGEAELHTARKITLRITPERTVLKGNGQDICFVLIELVGEDGSMIPAEDIPVTVTVSGAASLQGLGSARCISSERYTDATCTLWQGRCLAAVRTGYTAGNAEITVQADGYKTQHIKLTIEKTEA